MSASSQDYYNYLTRTDHPVFRKVFSDTVDETTPLNSIMNRVLADQLVKLKAQIDDLRANAFEHTATLTLIASWEESYFGYTKPDLNFTARLAQMLSKANTRQSMDVLTVTLLSQAITGQTPRVIRNMYIGGWVLGQSVLGLDTIFNGDDEDSSPFEYVVVFENPLTSDLKAKLDTALSQVEKGGSFHVLIAPNPSWILGQSVLGVDTILG